jgi:hypothetical protein
MNNQEMRRLKERLNMVDYEIAHKTGIRYDTIVDFFKGKIDELEPKHREQISEVLLKKAKRKKLPM